MKRRTIGWALAGMALIVLIGLAIPLVPHQQISKRVPPSSGKPSGPTLFKIRAITAFVSMSPAELEAQVNTISNSLVKARKRFQEGGYEVQTIRLATQPFPEYVKGLSNERALSLIQRLDAAAVKQGLDLSIGPGIVDDTSDPERVALLTDILSRTKTTNTSVAVTGSDMRIHHEAIHAAALVMKNLATTSTGGIGNFSFAAAANCPAGIPFFPTAYHGGGPIQFALAIQSASLLQHVFAHASNFEEARINLGATFQGQLQPLEQIAQQVAKDTNWIYAGMDVSTAPLKEVSIGAAIETLSGVPFGEHGTLTVASLITDVLRSLRLKTTGYSGLMIPVMEDATIARRAAEGRVTLDKLLMFSSVCATGIDVAPLPGDTPVEQIERIISDVATLSVKLHKPLAVRLLVVPGKKVGDMTGFDDPFLVNTKVMRVN